jgi:formylglycine-generating enzyme required for sulfatase activity
MFEKPLFRSIATLAAALAVLALGTAAQADVFNMPDGHTSLETVPVGNLLNTGELSGEGAGGFGPPRICGAVDYAYNIGTYEVTAAQYTEFLNAVATTADPYGLYNASMWSNDYGCKIERTLNVSSGIYTYGVAADRADRPVNYVSWGDAARFANWLHNDQPMGAQNLSTTEDGAYYLNGATSDEDLMAVDREADWKWAITSEDEWCKAAYHKNDGDTGNYFYYPTSNDSEPSNDLTDPDGGNNANFYQGGYTIGGPYWTTVVGDFEESESPYDTFDQGGNLWEWNEAVAYAGSFRGVRGGYWDYHFSGIEILAASSRIVSSPAIEDYGIGFRVANVPEPGDANNDGVVDDKDASILGANWMQTGAEWADGDFNRDHVVNDKDAAILAAHWSQTQEAGTSVPEPSTAALILGLIVAGLAARRRR